MNKILTFKVWKDETMKESTGEITIEIMNNKITYHSPYLGLPNRKKKLLTKEFLQTFKDEIIKEDKKYRKEHNDKQINYDDANYFTFYRCLTGTQIFYDALKTLVRNIM